MPREEIVDNMGRREALRGAEEKIFDILAQVLTSRQWEELLKAPLERVAAQGNRGLVQKLAGAGAKIGNALHAAARRGHRDVVNDLLESGASVAAKDMSGDTPLHDAAVHGTSQMVQLLLLKGAEKDALNNHEQTPLYLAVSCDKVAVALALLAAGADITLRYPAHKETILHVAGASGHHHVDIMRAVIESGADVNAVDTKKRTPLHRATRYNNRAGAIDVLVEAGADIEARDRDGCTPLHYATDQVCLGTSLALLKHGAHVNNQQNVNSQTPLHLAAARAGNEVAAAELVDCLLRSGADETILNDEGKSAADIVGQKVHAPYQLKEDVGRVRELLANAPADRAWRRRGYMVLCRAHPDRRQQIHKGSSAHTGIARRTRSSAKLARTETGSTGATGSSVTNGRIGGDWTVVVAQVLELQEEGVFRTILGYL